MYQDQPRYYSTTDELLNASSKEPLTYVDWLQYETNFNKTNAFEQYIKYLSDWYKRKGISDSETQQRYIKNIYTELLKQISLEYTTPDEKRFLQNMDYQSQQDLDIALPFFAKKIKQIAIYYANQRDELKFSPIKANLKGSGFGINQIVYKQIADIIKYDPDINTQLADLELTEQDVLVNLKVDVRELYDTEQNYYNIPQDAVAEEYTGAETHRLNYFDASLLPDRAKMFLEDTLTDTLIELIKEVPVLLESGIQSVTQNDSKELRDIEDRSFAVTDIILGTELDRLDDSKFINYNNTGELNITYEQLAFRKYCGTDYYYLSTGDTISDSVTGKLFTADNPHRNILNRFYPTLIPTPGENLYREQYIGGFFQTTGVGLLTYTTLDFTYRFKPTGTGETHFFPDPSVGAAGFFGAAKTFETVVSYYENVNWHRTSITNHYGHGLQRQYSNLMRFTPYQSESDSNQSHKGVSRHDDTFDYWTHDGRNIWKNLDIFPLEDDRFQDIDDRTQDLLLGNKVIHNWRTDIYGNDFALIKESVVPEKALPINTAETIYDTQYKTIEVSDTQPKSNFKNLITDEPHENKLLTEQRTTSGTLYVRNNSAERIQTLDSPSLSGLFSKYTVPGTINYRDGVLEITSIHNEIKTSIINFDLVYDTLIIETNNYIVFEQINYNYSNAYITSKNEHFAFIKKDYFGNEFELTSNWWYDEKNSRILITKTTIHPELSGTTDKMIYPEIYIYSLSTGTLKRTYPDPDLNDDQLIYETSQYSLSSINKFNIIDIVKVKTPKLTYNSDSERFTQMQLGYDSADNMFLLKNDFLLYDTTVDAVKTHVYKNKYVIYTVNPRNESIQRTFFYETNPTLTYLNISQFTYFHDQQRKLLFMACLQGQLTSNPISQPNSSAVWIHGTSPQNMQSDRDIVMVFDFKTTGFIDGDTTARPNGLSVIFFQARVSDQVNTQPGASEPEYELLDTGGLGPAFSYLDDTTTGTNTQASLTGLDSGHACVAFDVVGNVGNNSKTPNNITVFGPFDSTNKFSETINIDTTKYNMYQDINTVDDYTDLDFIRCKVTLTDLGRRITVHMKNISEDSDFEKVADVDLTPATDPSRVIYDGKTFKCATSHTSTALLQPDNDTRVTYSGIVYRCLRDHYSVSSKPPVNDRFNWQIDGQWDYTAPAWAASVNYERSKWILEYDLDNIVEAPDWAESQSYIQEHILPSRVKAALTANTSDTNAGLVVINNITVTGAGNNT